MPVFRPKPMHYVIAALTWAAIGFAIFNVI